MVVLRRFATPVPTDYYNITGTPVVSFTRENNDFMFPSADGNTEFGFAPADGLVFVESRPSPVVVAYDLNRMEGTWTLKDVPEAGLTLPMLGMAISGLALMRRKVSKRE